MPERIQVHENGRFLQREDGAPFFYLGDTAWELFHRLTLADAAYYLTARARQGFTVIQAVVLAEMDGLTVPNANGDLPLHDMDPTRPNGAYFDHVDAIVRIANDLGLVVALLPTWGDKVNKMWGGGPEIFDASNARSFGAFLGDRYRSADLIWVLGGDRAVEDDRIKGIWRAMAEGLGNDHIRTFHPNGGQASSTWLHDEPWLDFNMIQSGHHERNADNAAMLDRDYARVPTKPCMEAESAYEDHPVNWKPTELGWFSDIEVRRPSYWGVFAGGHGLTYGCHDVWQFWEPHGDPVAWARTPWREALSLPVAGQMAFLKSLMLSRPFFDRVPDQGLILDSGGARLRATSGPGYAFVYFPSRVTARLDVSRFSFASWFDPRTGASTPTEINDAFTPPADEDWVLTLDAKHLLEPPSWVA